MSLEPSWSLVLELPRRHLEALATRLAALGFPAFEERPTRRGVCVVVYAPSVPALEALRDALLRGLASDGVAAGEVGVELVEVPSSWALEWTKYLEPVELTPSLRLFPWRPTRPPLASELYLEPAFAFGFGEHPSTRLAARWLEASCQGAPGCSVLDVGCGTGVLAFVARRAGAGAVTGVDLSSAAIAAARVNAEVNAIDGVAFCCGQVADVHDTFARVVANIEASVLSALAPDLAARVAPAGELGLSGFIAEQCDDLVHRYAEAGLRLERRASSGDWCLLVGTRPA